MCFHSPQRPFPKKLQIARLLQTGFVGLLAVGALGVLPAAVKAQECLYVLDQLNNAITSFRRSTNTMVTTLPIPKNDCAQPPCHPMPTSLRLSDGAARGYVTRQDVNLLYVLDPIGSTVAGTVPIDSGSASVAASAAAALSPDGATLYIANIAADSLSVIDTSSKQLTKTISVGDGPRAVAVTPDGATVFVGNSHNNSVSVVRAADGMVLTPITAGHAPAGMAVSGDGTQLYVTNDNDGTVSVIDVATRAVVDTITVGHRPRGVAFAPSGALAYVTNVQDATVSVIDTTTRAVVGDPIAVGNAPVAIVVSDDGATAYVADLSANTVSVINTANRAVTSIALTGSPFDLALGVCPTAAAPTPTPGAACVGDCSGDGQVLVNELITGVNIALGNQPVSTCPAFDADHSGMVEINELIAAVNNALTGCPA
jgi:YVTN family beta-propeller protein